MMTLEELNDNFAAHAEAIYKATSASVGLTYDGQSAIHDTVRDVMTQLAGPQFGRDWGGMEAAAKTAIEKTLNPKLKLKPIVEEAEEEPSPKPKKK